MTLDDIYQGNEVVISVLDEIVKELKGKW